MSLRYLGLCRLYFVKIFLSDILALNEGHIAADMVSLNLSQSNQTATNLFPLYRTPTLSSVKETASRISSMNETTSKTPSMCGTVPRASNSTTVHIAVASPIFHFSLLRQGHTVAQYRGESTDLTLVSQDGGEIHIHRCVILPLSPLLTSLAKEQVWCCAQPRVVLAEQSLETVTAMVSLIYTGTCRLDRTTRELVQEALDSLGINIPECKLQIEDVEYKVREHEHTFQRNPERKNKDWLII